MSEAPEIKECLRCGYHGPRLRSYSTSIFDRNLYIRILSVPILLIPGAGKFFFYSIFNGVAQCPHCGDTENFAFWKGEVSEAEMDLWRVLQKKEDQIKADRDRRFRWTAFVGLSAVAIAIIIFRNSLFE